MPSASPSNNTAPTQGKLVRRRLYRTSASEGWRITRAGDSRHDDAERGRYKNHLKHLAGHRGDQHSVSKLAAEFQCCQPGASSQKTENRTPSSLLSTRPIPGCCVFVQQASRR